MISNGNMLGNLLGGSLFGQLGQQNQLAAYHQQRANSDHMMAAQQLLGLQNYMQTPFLSAIKSDGAYEMARAKSYAKDGNRLIERIYFWSAFGIVGRPIVRRLTGKLEAAAAEVERWIEMAEAAKRA